LRWQISTKPQILKEIVGWLVCLSLLGKGLRRNKGMGGCWGGGAEAADQHIIL
jgi:hypothetical protein